MTEERYHFFLQSTGVCTDTRKLKNGNIFFALKGPSFNGNLFAKKALEEGAAYAVIDEKPDEKDDRFILVTDVLTSLQDLAAYHRSKLKIPVIAIGGSNGKTTTKELIKSILSTKYKTFATSGNLNNHIGVPLSILSLTKEHEIAIIELGANHLGETTLLCTIAQPTAGLITNNGKDHLEGYGNIEGVIKGNGELYEYLAANSGTAFVCADQPDLMRNSAEIKRVTYGNNPSADINGDVREIFPDLSVNYFKNDKPIIIESQLFGKYNFDNIMAAICVGEHYQVDEHNIALAIKSYTPANNRSQYILRDSNTFIMDAYNANPSSMAVAVENFAAMPVKDKTAILGDMLELGTSSAEEHGAMIKMLQNISGINAIYVGDEFKKALTELNGSAPFLHFASVKELKEWFTKQNFTHHYFLLKGSRLIGLEKLLE